MTTKIAVSLPDEQVAAARRAVDQGRAASVSGFVSDALRQTVREDALVTLLADMDEELGKVPDDVQRAADEALGLA
jgi:Arc/MetJ-type ribon-helix-helix transcriptional regulator